MSARLLLALDLGTTAIKVGLFSVTGDLLRVETRDQKLLFDGRGRVEQSPLETWDLVGDAIRGVTAEAPVAEIAAVALSLQRGTVIPLSAEGEPLSNFLVWMDKRGLPIATELAEQVGREHYYRIMGHPITYVSGVSKVLWLHRNDPGTTRVGSIIAPPETLFLKWLGVEELVCAQSTATYLFPTEIETKEWSGVLAEAFNLPLEKLPRQVTGTEVVGRLSERAAVALGLVPGIALVAGGGDGQCAAAGSGVTRPGPCMINIGTGAGVQVFLPHPVKDPHCVLNCAAHVDPQAWELEGHTQASGASFRWWRDEFGAVERALQRDTGRDAFDVLVEEALLAPAGADGLLFLPLLNGSTAPQVDQEARGSLLGLGLAHRRNHVIRALLEGISLELRWMLDAIETAGSSVEEVRLTGGGSRNDSWNQIHADILNRPVCSLGTSDAALVGAAMCAAVAIGEYANLNEAAADFVKIMSTVEPRPQNTAVYAAAYDAYREAFARLSESGIFRQLQQPIFQDRDR